MSSYRRQRPSRGSFDQNVGVPGVVYILRNAALKDNYCKIGCSRHSGARRARELNDQAGTAIPATFECVLEVPVADCGTAERLVHARLRIHRRGRHGRIYGRDWGQEFFEVDLDVASAEVRRACAEVDLKVRAEEERRRQAIEQEAHAEPAFVALAPPPAAEEPSEPHPSWLSPQPAQRGAPSPILVFGALVILCIAYSLLVGSRPNRTASLSSVAAPRFASPSPSPSVRSSGDGTTPTSGAGDTDVNSHVPPSSAFPRTPSAVYPQGSPSPQGLSGSLKLYAPASSLIRHVVLVLRVPGDAVFAQVFLEANDIVDLGLPEGTFRIVYGSGFEWYGARAMFGPNHPLQSLGQAFSVGRGTRYKVDLPIKEG